MTVQDAPYLDGRFKFFETDQGQWLMSPHSSFFKNPDILS